jgi:hypothetical protein
MITFPNEEMRHQVAKFRSFEFETANVKANALPTEMSAVWVKVHKIPSFARKVEVVIWRLHILWGIQKR